jgi:hypothetical protein
MKCSKCKEEIGQPGTSGNYVECKRVFTGGEQITLGYLEREWQICFDCWAKLYYGKSVYRFTPVTQEELDEWHRNAP